MNYAYRKPLPPKISIAENVITVQSLGHPKDVTSFIRCFLEGKAKGITSFEIDLTKTEKYFPNAAVPIATIIDALKNEGYNFTSITGQSLFDSLNEPISATTELLEKINEPLSKVWKFNSDNIHLLVNKYIESIATHIECPEGVLDTIEWCINEVMDNVAEHSKETSGFVMAQVHTSSKRITICVADAGIGIFKSFSGSKYRPRSDADAITLSISKV